MANELPMNQFEVRSTNTGLLVDETGTGLMLISVNEFQQWWRSLESSFQSPIGRKLIYAASDDEEYFLATNPSYKIPKWFGKKKIVQAMGLRWTSMGWGLHFPDAKRIQSPCHDSLSAGIGLAHHEHVEQQRYRMEWRQINSDLIEMDFTNRAEDIPIAPPAPSPEWASPVDLADIHTHPIEHEFEPRSFGFFWGQKRSIFLPISILHRLFDSIIGRPFNSERHHREGIQVTGVSEQSSLLFLTLVESSAAMFQASDYSIFLQNQGDWESHIQHNIISRGCGHVTVDHFSLEDGPSSCMTVHSPLPTFTVGLLVSMWERAHGSPCICDVEIISNLLKIHLRPRSVEYI